MQSKIKIILWVVVVLLIITALTGYLYATKKIKWFNGSSMATEQPLPINNSLKTSVTVLPKAE